MSLVPKITVATVDNLLGKTIKIQDTTGAYNAGTNPGGYGTPNYDSTDVDWVLLLLRNYSTDKYTTIKLTSLTDLFGAGHTLDGLTDGVFEDGVYELKYYPVIGNPVEDNTVTNVTWTLGSKTFALGNADTLLAGAMAIVLTDQSKLFYLDPNNPPTSGQATVTEVLPSSGTAPLAIAYEADTRFLVTAAADNCLATDTGLIIKWCSCFDERMSNLFLRMGQREGVTIHFSKQNYQAAHDIITQLAAYCKNLSNCGCK